MKNKGVRFLLRAVCALGLAMMGHVYAQSAQVAVVGDPSLGALIDVTTAELSSQPNLTVLERADLDKLGQEKALQSALGSNDFSVVRLVPADGLVLLRAVKQDGKVGVFARLVAVQPGVVLREVALPDGADPQAQADTLMKEFAPCWPKLAALKKGKITALSLLGLRFEVAGAEAQEVERRINVLLASRLGAEPDTLVLERWRLNDAVFEKSLTAQQSSPFWTGSSLIDGSMKWVDKTIEVTLRMRPSQGAEVSISDKDTADNLPALVGRLADKVRNHPISQGAWNPSAEAGHYAELGKWCLDNRLYDEGAQAIESALALGDDSPATHRLQLRAYTSLVYPAQTLTADSIYEPHDAPVIPESLPGRIKWGMTAANLAGRYLQANQNFAGQPDSPEDPAALSLPALDNCLRLLRYAYQKSYAKTHQEDTTALRHSVQNLIGLMEPVLAKRPSDQHDAFVTRKVRYAPYWHETPEDTVAYYRDLLNSEADGAVIRTELFASLYFVMHPFYLLPEAQLPVDASDDGPQKGDWYVASPRLIAWDDRPLAEITVLWEKFQDELRASADPILQADAMKFEFSAVFRRYKRPGGEGGRFVTFLEQNQPALSGPRGNELLMGFDVTLNDIDSATDQGNRERLRVIGEALLKQRVILPTEWIKWMPRLYRDAPADMAQRLLASLDAYRQWYQTQAPRDPEMVTALEQARRPLVIYAVGTALGSNKDSFLTVNQHWPLEAGNPQGPEFMRTMPFPVSITTAENKVWFLMYGGSRILCVDPATLQTISTFNIPDNLIPDRAHSPENVALTLTPQYLVVAMCGHVLLCSRTDNSWRLLDLPSSNYKPCWINQQLYLIYETHDLLAQLRDTPDKTPSEAISGLIHVSLPAGTIENLVSTRRTPPQSALDGKPLGYPLDLWSSPAGLMLAVDADSPHFQVFGTPTGKNDWTPVTTDPLSCDVKQGAGGELVGKGFDGHGFAQIALMNGKASDLLLSNPNRAPGGGGGTTRWDFPEDIQKTSPDIVSQVSAVMRGDDLCLYRNTMSPINDGLPASLYYFPKGQKAGVKIPLKFQGPANQNPMLVRVQSAIQNYQSLQATDYGLVVVQVMGGFWIVPWKDIDAYCAQAAGDATAPEPVVAQPAPAPTPTPPVIQPAPAPPENPTPPAPSPMPAAQVSTPIPAPPVTPPAPVVAPRPTSPPAQLHMLPPPPPAPQPGPD